MCSDKLKMYSYKTIYQSMKCLDLTTYRVYYGHCPFSNLWNTHLVHDGIHNATVDTVVSARQNLQSALCYRPPVHPSVHLSKGWMTINQKRLVKIVQFSPYTTSFCGISFMQKFSWISLSGSIKQGWGWNELFSSFMHLYLENGTR